MINYTTFRRLLISSSECPEKDAYIAEVGGSVPMDDVCKVVPLLSAVWAMGHAGLTVKSISAACGVAMRQIALTYGLPIRTVEAWSTGNRTPPEWQLPLIAYAVLSDYIGELI